MTHEREIEHVLDLWFADGPTEVPDRVFDVVADRIERQSQRPAWRLHWREPHVNTYLKPLVALAAVIVVAVVGYNLLPANQPGVGGPSVTPSASASATPVPSPSPVSLTSEPWDQLDPGTYVHDAAKPALTLTVPAGWWLSTEIPNTFGIRPEAYTSDEGIRTWYDMRVAVNDAACTEAPDPTIGHTADDLIAAFTSRPGIVATDPQPISIGGLEGQWIDLHLSPDWTATCPFDPSLGPSVTLFTDADPANGDNTPFWGVSNTEQLRIIALDDRAGSSVLIIVNAVEATYDTLLAESMSVIDTFEFDLAP